MMQQMVSRTIHRHWWKWSFLLTGTIIGILPGGCENTILRIATPFLI